MFKLKISYIDRERNFCEEDSHSIVYNHPEVINVDDADDQKPIDKEKMREMLQKVSGQKLVVLELGGLKVDFELIDLIASSNSGVECIRIYDCIGLTDECLKIIGHKFGKTLKHLEILGFTSFHTNEGVKELLSLIGNLEVVHMDVAITLLSTMTGSVTNLKHVWSKVSFGEKEVFQQFSVKYAQYLKNLDITFSGTKSETPDYVNIIANFNNLIKLSITATGDQPIDKQLSLIGEKLGKQLKALNICVWCGNDAYLEALSKFTELESLTLNGRSPMRHIDFSLSTNLQKLSSITNLKQFRLILKNHSENLFDGIDKYLPKLDVLEIVGLNITDSAFKSIANLKHLSFLDVVSPLITDAGLVELLTKNNTLVYFRPNGGEKITTKTLDAITASARNRPENQIECILNTDAKVGDIKTKSNILANLKLDVQVSQYLLTFPGSTPRGF